MMLWIVLASVLAGVLCQTNEADQVDITSLVNMLFTQSPEANETAAVTESTVADETIGLSEAVASSTLEAVASSTLEAAAMPSTPETVAMFSTPEPIITPSSPAALVTPLIPVSAQTFEMAMTGESENRIAENVSFD